MAAYGRKYTRMGIEMGNLIGERPTEPLSDAERVALNTICEGVVGAFYEVANTLGPGFLEKVYEQALIQELSLRGLIAEAQVAIPVRYKSVVIGTYFADVLVEDKLIVELKCVERFSDEHFAQCINYLKATGKRLCLLVNFQRAKVQWQRIAFHF